GGADDVAVDGHGDAGVAGGGRGRVRAMARPVAWREGIVLGDIRLAEALDVEPRTDELVAACGRGEVGAGNAGAVAVRGAWVDLVVGKGWVLGPDPGVDDSDDDALTSICLAAQLVPDADTRTQAEERRRERGVDV